MKSPRFLLLIATAAFASVAVAHGQTANSSAQRPGAATGAQRSNASSGAATASPGMPGISGPGNGNTTGGSAAPIIMATDPGYRLSLGDEIVISVHNESDISTAQRIDKKGAVRMYLIDEVVLADKTVREAESFIEKTLIERKILKKPLVSITVRDYATNEITLTGRGIQPGVFPLPREVASIEIVELITRHGGFLANAKSNEVKVYRKNEAGREESFTVDVEAMIASKKNALKSFLIYPGDRIYVEERLF